MFECSNKSLSAVASWVGQSLDGKTANPAYSMVRFKVSPDDMKKLHVSCTNRDSTSKASIVLEGEAHEPADFLLPGVIFMNYSKMAPAGGVTKFSGAPRNGTRVPAESFNSTESGTETHETVGVENTPSSVKDSTVVLKSGKFSTKTPSLPSDKASLPLTEPEIWGTFSGSDFAHAVKLAVTAAAGDKTSIPVFTGVQITVDEENETLTFVATDRYRLACVKINYTPNSTEGPRTEKHDRGSVGSSEADSGDVSEDSGEDVGTKKAFVVPAKILEQYGRFFVNSENVSFGFSEEESSGGGVFLVSDGDRSSTTRLLDGDYPNWPPILESVEQNKDVEIVFTSDALLQSTKRVSAMNQNSAPVILTFSEGETELKTIGDDKLTTEDSLSTDYYGDVFSAKYASEYLTSFLSNTDGDVIYVTSLVKNSEGETVKDSKKPGCFKPVNIDEQGDFTYILMPLG